MNPWHALHLGGSLGAHLAFRRALGAPEQAQRRRLTMILGNLAGTAAWGGLAGLGYEAFRERVPPRAFEDLEGHLDRQRETGATVLCPRPRRWQPTSGSTRRRKWIPYPAAFLKELDAAAGAWMVDLALRCPEAFRGRHYWSLSWVPTELRRSGLDPDDLNLLPAWKRALLGRVMAVPPAVGDLPDSGTALVATAACLAAAEDLSLLSVWSPTFALALLRTLGEQREEVAWLLEGGPWGWPLPMPRNPRAAFLLRHWNGVPTPDFLAELWPRLALASAWDAAGSAPFAARLGALLPRARLQGKGLWATEGVVTIPFRDHLPLALTSHFLEFRCLATGRILPAWALEPDQELQPLLTTSGGLVRCALEDRVRVTGFLERTPCLAFLGRLGGTDLVGEKLDEGAVGEVLDRLALRHAPKPLTLYALDGSPPRYRLLAEGPEDPTLAPALEAALGAFHHYRLARELGQLGPAEAMILTDATPLLAERARRRGLSPGEAKVRRLEVWEGAP